VRKTANEKLLAVFRGWFFGRDEIFKRLVSCQTIKTVEKELSEYYGEECCGRYLFAAYCAGYFAGKREAGK
jgi:hypothetical protein